jgi:hypothetical protein
MRRRPGISADRTADHFIWYALNLPFVREDMAKEPTPAGKLEVAMRAYQRDYIGRTELLALIDGNWGTLSDRSTSAKDPK